MEKPADTLCIEYFKHALHSKVMTVAVVSHLVGDWAAYAFNVPGQCHKNEWQAWEREGCKLSQHIAEAIFGDIIENINHTRELTERHKLYWRN